MASSFMEIMSDIVISQPKDQTNYSPSGRRDILINSEIDDTLVQNVIVNLHYLLEEDAKLKEPKPINVFLNTCGGEAFPAMTLVSQLLKSEAPIYTYNLGRCYSAGFLIFLAGSKRFTTKYNSFMDHGLYSWAEGAPDDMEKQVAKSKKLEKLIQEYVKSRTKLTTKQITGRDSDEDWWLGEDAIRDGIATDLY